MTGFNVDTELVITQLSSSILSVRAYRWLVMERLVSGKLESGQEKGLTAVQGVDAQVKTENMRDFISFKT